MRNLKDTAPSPESSEAILAERKKRMLGPRAVVFFLISIVLVGVLLWKMDIAQALSSFRNAHLGWVLVACCAYFLSNFCKAVRYRAMLRHLNIGLFEMFAITSYQNFYNQIMPARTGELTLVYYLKTLGNAKISKGLHVLLVTRIYDFIIVAAFFVGSVALYYGRKSSPALVAAGVGFLLFSIAVLFYLKHIIRWGMDFFNLTMRALGLEKKKLVMKFNEKMEPVVREFVEYDTLKEVPVLVLTSVLVWSVLYVFAYVTILAWRVEINFLLSIAGSTGQVLANVLPINSFGSFGTLEAGWAGGYMLAGMKRQDAIATAFGYHIINFIASGFIAAVCYGILKIKK